VGATETGCKVDGPQAARRKVKIAKVFKKRNDFFMDDFQSFYCPRIIPIKKAETAVMPPLF
jgi:transposase